ncbi:MAG: IPExxxVDY family protein [Croceivirga sp.]
MVTVHKISEELFFDSFDLIALHCNLECYAMAYHINQVVDITLKRAKHDLEIDSYSYPMYEYHDEVNEQGWFLIKNRIQVEENEVGDGLFQNGKTMKTKYFLEERKEINYLLKLWPESTIEIDKTIDAIRSVSKILMAYVLDIDSLKSKRNLIF